ncbi:hypothetical protein LPJ61_005769, partial [Coemansia biformis]
AYSYDSYNLPLFAQFPDVSPEATRLAQLECLPLVGNLMVCGIMGRFIGHAMEFGCLSQSTKMKMWGLTAFVFVFGLIPFFNVWLVYRLKPLYQCWRLFSQDVGSKGLYSGMTELDIRAISMTVAARQAPGAGRATMQPAGGGKPGSSSHTMSVTTLNDARSLNSKYYSKAPAPKGHAEQYRDVKHAANTSRAPETSKGNNNDNDDSRERRGYSSFCPVSTARNTMAESTYGQHTAKADSEYDRRTTIADSDYDPRSTKHSFESARASTFPEEADFLKSKYSLRQSAIDNWPLK